MRRCELKNKLKLISYFVVHTLTFLFMFKAHRFFAEKQAYGTSRVKQMCLSSNNFYVKIK